MSDICEKLHFKINALKRFSFVNHTDTALEIPQNGIYFLFETGEKSHSQDKIVRIGTHTGQDRLKLRLFEHFITPNKDRSIFRKHIGRCLLSQDSFLDYWNIDFTKTAIRDRFYIPENNTKQKIIEQKVTDYIRNHFTFSVLEVTDKHKRLSLEENFLSTCHACSKCVPSVDWLGLRHQNSTIHKGLWNIKGLNGSVLSENYF